MQFYYHSEAYQWSKQNRMVTTITLLAFYTTMADDKGFRGWLLVMVLLAVILIMAGCALALLTWYYQRKAKAGE
jgi:hypothetical protein